MPVRNTLLARVDALCRARYADTHGCLTLKCTFSIFLIPFGLGQCPVG